MLKQKLQIVKFKVAKGETVDVNTNTKLEHDSIESVFLRLSNEDALSGARLRLEVNSEEILPDGTEAAIIHHNSNTAINDVAYPVQEEAKNSNLRITFKDNSELLATGDEYEVTVYLIANVQRK